MHRHTEPRNRPAVTIQLSSYNFEPNTLAYLSQWMGQSLNQILGFTRDTVHAIRCPMWPAEAAEWETRSRPSGWPAKELVKRVVDSGCHFVQKPHQSHPKDSTECSFSFSIAELVLIQSWSSHQKYIYHLLRKVKNMLQRNCNLTTLHTYNFKTLMLWESEKQDSSFWDPVNTSAALEMLLTRMVEWMEDTCCPNYFIPGNNMWDHLPRVDFHSYFQAEIVWLRDFLNYGIHDLIEKDFKFCPNCKMFGKFQEAFLPLLNCVLNTNKFRTKSEQQISEKTKEILVQRELQHLIRGLTFQISSMRFTGDVVQDETINRYCEDEAEKNFRESMISRNEEYLPKDNIFLKQMLSEIISVWCNNFLVKDPYTLGKSIEWPVHDCSCKTNGAIDFLGEIFSEIASRFPKLSYFTGAVFLANLYYRNGCYSRAAAVCDEALEDFQKNFWFRILPLCCSSADI